MDTFWDDFKLQNSTDNLKKYENPELCWLITASFHDMGYPVQKYDKWSEKFLQQVFKIKSSPGTLEFKSNFVDEHFLFCMGYLICELCCTHLNKNQEPPIDWFASENDHVQFFYQQITDKKNHGVMSSISLLKVILFTSDDEDIPNKIKIERKIGDFPRFLKETLVPSALAIALHDSEIWKGEYVIKDKIQKVPNFIKNINFVDNPLTFLLIFCDTIQEWGRPNFAIAIESEKKQKKFYLKEFVCVPKKYENDILIEKGEVKVTLWTPDADQSEEFFKRKENELMMVKQFLVQPTDIRFVIHLKDNKEDHTPKVFEMDGSSPLVNTCK
jgi:hypothetical protein